MKPERWGSPLVQEKCREEKACDKRHPYRIIIIIIINKNMSKGMKRESEKSRTTGKKNKERKKDLQLKEGVKKNRMGFRSYERKQEIGYLKESI